MQFSYTADKSCVNNGFIGDFVDKIFIPCKSIKVLGSFALSAKDFNSILPRDNSRYSNREWVNIIKEGVAESNSYCVFNFKSHNWGKTKFSKYRFIAKNGTCKYAPECSCQATVTLCHENVPLRLFNVHYTGFIRHFRNDAGGRFNPCTGNKRTAIKKVMELVTPRQYTQMIMKDVIKQPDIIKSGNRNNIFNSNVLKQIRYEANIPDGYDFRNETESINKLQNIENTIVQEYSVKPSSLKLWNKDLLKIFHDRSKTDVVYIDATGSVIRGKTGVKQYLIYEIVVRHPEKGGTPISVGSFLTNNQTTSNIAIFLMRFKAAVAEIGNAQTVRHIICDGCQALINAILYVFMRETFTEYINRCFELVTGAINNFSLGYIHNCTSHAMKCFTNLVKRAPYNIRTQLKYLFGYLLTVDMLEDLEQCVYQMTILLETKNEKLATDSWLYFNDKILRIEDQVKSTVEIDLKTDDGEDSEEEEEEYEPDFRNKFYNHFTKIIHKARVLMTSPNHVECGVNKWHCPIIMKTFETYWIQRLPLWTSLTINNLGRHGLTEPYINYSTNYIKLEKSAAQTYCRNNRTQGIIEKSMQELKRTRLRNYRRYKNMAELAYHLNESTQVCVVQYYDSLPGLKNRLQKLEQQNLEPQSVWGKGKTKSNEVKRKQTNLGTYVKPPKKKHAKLFNKDVKNKSDSDDNIVEVPLQNPTCMLSLKRQDSGFYNCTFSRCAKLNTNRLLNGRDKRFKTEDIDFCMAVIKQHFSGIGGFQSVEAYSPDADFKPFYTPKSKFIQIIHVHGETNSSTKNERRMGGHWVTFSNIFAQRENEVLAYDSLYGEYTECDLFRISKLIRTNEKNIICAFPSVQRQNPLLDNCGPFAIAFAAALAQNIKPETIECDEEFLRSEVVLMMVNKEVTPLFKEVKDATNSFTLINELIIDVYCVCRLSHLKTLEMIQCNCCEDWFHTTTQCVKPISADIITDDNACWFCLKCATHMQQRNLVC